MANKLLCLLVCTIITQYENIDSEHRALFKAVFEMAEAPHETAALQYFVDATKKHFTTEQVRRRNVIVFLAC